MSSHSFYDRSHFSASASSSSQRQNLQNTPRPTSSYSSLNEALGSDRPPDPAFPHPFHPPDPPMSSDSRYVYQQHPPGMTSYDYPAYAQSTYSQPPFPPNPARPPPRTAPPQSPSPTQQGSYNPSQAQAPYHQSYGSTQFAPVPPSTSQWSGEGWSTTQQYSQFAAPPIQDPPAIELQGRPDPAPGASAQRPYAPAPPSTEPHRNPEPAQALEPPPQPKRKQREQQEPSARAPSPPPLGLDFHKLLESYRVIIETTKALSTDPATAHGRPPPPDALQRMLHSANYGWQVLSAAAGPPPAVEGPPPPIPGPPPPAPPPVGGDEGEGASLKRQKSEGPVPEGQTCLGCNATSTPEWRRGPLGPRTLCNACGLVYAKLIKKRNREVARKAGARPRARSGSAPPDDAGMPSSGEEDEDSYASQEFRSEVGDHGGRG